MVAILIWSRFILRYFGRVNVKDEIARASDFCLWLNLE